MRATKREKGGGGRKYKGQLIFLANIENGLQDRCYWSKSARLNLNFSGEKRREGRANSMKNFVSC